MPIRQSAGISGWFGFVGVGVSESAGPLVVSVGEFLVGPAALVFDAVVVAAVGVDVERFGWAAFGPVNGVVEVGVNTVDEAAFHDTVGAVRPDDALLLGGGPSPGDSHADGLASIRVGNHKFPDAISVLVGDLSGHVGDDRPVAGQITWVVGESGEGGEVDADVH